MTTRIIIARHGNTFNKGDVITRVGGKTDLPLVEEERGTNIGLLLKEVDLMPDVVFAAPLKRTMETAKLAVSAMGLVLKINEDNSFREINYGPDENRPEDEVRLRLGTLAAKKEGKNIPDLSVEELLAKGDEVLDLWNSKAVVPDGWEVSPDEMIETWLSWGKKVATEYKDQNVLIVSSNGIIRFAPYLTGNFVGFAKENDLKVGTGNICIFEKSEKSEHWICRAWNEKPKDVLKEIYEEEQGCCGGGCGCGGHHHEHEHEHECCGGHGHHEEGHQCCGGHGHHHEEEHECCGGGCGCGHKH